VRLHAEYRHRKVVRSPIELAAQVNR
jgi:hypothetical protein